MLASANMDCPKKKKCLTYVSFSRWVLAFTLVIHYVAAVWQIIICANLPTTDKESRRGSQNTDGRAAGLLAEISLQSQRVRAEQYRSLQHMGLQRAELQDSLRQERDACHNTLLEQQEVSYTMIRSAQSLKAVQLK